MKRRSDGSYFGFSESFEGFLCIFGWASFCTMIIHIIAATVMSVIDWRRRLIKKHEKVEISDNGPVNFDEQ